MTAVWDARAAARRMDQADLDDEAIYRAPEAYVRVWNKFMEEEGVVGDYLSKVHGKKRNAVGTATIELPHDTQFRSHLLNNPDGEDAMIPLTIDTPGDRWSGKVERVTLLRDADGTETIEVSALCDLQHVATTCLWASPGAPLWAQFPRHSIKIGPARSICTSWLDENITRLQRPRGSDNWPIAVVPTNVWTDTSKWAGGSARFDMAFPFLEQFLKDAGLVIRAEMFLPEEDEQPAPEWFWLDQPTIVIRIDDESNVTGPTGTLLDGLVSWFEDFLDDGTTPVRYPNFGAETDYEQAYASGRLGTRTKFPHVWYFQSEYDGLGDMQIAVHKPPATDILVGGRSPSYINAAIEIAIKNMLSWLGLLIGVPGLDSLYRGQLDDVFLAFDVGVDIGRVQRAGPYAWRELFMTGSEKAFTIDGQMAKLQGLYDSRGYTSHKVTIQDFAPYIYGKDFRVGQQIGFALEQLLFTDYVTEAVHTDDRQTAARWTLTVGDGAKELHPVVRGWNRTKQLTQIVSVLSKDVGMEADFFGLF